MAPKAETAEKIAVTALVNRGGKPRWDLGAGGREIKMLAPTCTTSKMHALGLPEDEACQHPQNIGPEWWIACEAKGHMPYMVPHTETTRKPKYDPPELGPAGGTQRLVGYEDEVTEVNWHPHLVQISQSERINSDMGPLLYRSVGYLLPQERGLAAYCEYRDCWAQEPTFHTDWGSYCTRDQARMIGADVTGVRLEVMTHEDYGRKKRRDQLTKVVV